VPRDLENSSIQFSAPRARQEASNILLRQKGQIMRKSIVLSLVLVASLSLGADRELAEGQTKNTDLCMPKQVLLTLKRDWGLEVVSHSLLLEQATESPWVIGEMSLRNNTGLTITRITLIVSYFDDQGAYLFSITYHASTKDEIEQVQLRPFYQVKLNKPVRPHELILMDGTNLLITKVLPKNARGSNILIESTSGTLSGATETPWRSEPILEESPPYFEMATPGEPLPEEIMLVAKIDRNGRVAQLRTTEPGHTPSAILEKIRQQTEKWLFFPAIEGGFAVDHELNIRLRFRRKRALPIRECSSDLQKYPRVFATVDLIPLNEESSEWRFYFGGYPAGGKFQGQRVDLSTLGSKARMRRPTITKGG
jgi:hypothetical protein